MTYTIMFHHEQSNRWFSATSRTWKKEETAEKVINNHFKIEYPNIQFCVTVNVGE